MRVGAYVKETSIRTHFSQALKSEPSRPERFSESLAENK